MRTRPPRPNPFDVGPPRPNPFDVGMVDVPAAGPPIDLNSPAFGGTSGTGVSVPSTPIDNVKAAVSDTTKTTDQVQGVTQAMTETGQPAKIGGGQWIRQIKLTVYASTQGGNQSSGLDLSNLRINFSVHKAINSSSPNMLKAKVYNLSRPNGPDTVGKVKQYGRVQLACGYVGENNMTMIFDGQVVMYVQGKENATDTYLEIIAGDADAAKNHGVAALNWPAGSTPTQRNNDMLKAGGYQIGQVMPAKGEQKAIRACSFIGMVDKGIRANTNATQSDFFCDNGQAYVIPWDGYRMGDIVELSPTTGLINIPKVTPNGIEAQCLLNPKLRLGGLVKIASSFLSDVPYEPGSKNPFASQAIPFGPLIGSDFQYGAAATSTTGIYKILLLDHFGDTRGQDWQSNIVCCAAGADGNGLSGTFLGTAFFRTANPGPGVGH